MFEQEEFFSQKGYDFIVGVDEAGRGPLAGPVVSAAVCLKDKSFNNKIADSKKLSVIQRNKAFEEINQKAFVGVGIVDELMIDRINILQATYLAMNQAIEKLVLQLGEAFSDLNLNDKTIILIDGNSFKTSLPFKCKTIVKGDQTHFSIACASIIAKVTRDKLIESYDDKYPAYGFKSHKGYGTAQHRQAIKDHGLLDIHRKSFCKKYINA